MNLFTFAALAVATALLPCAEMSLRGSPERRLVGLEMTGMIIVISMALLAVGFHRPPFIDLALTLAIMSFGGGLVFARFLGQHL